MASFILQKATVQCWRLFQTLLVSVIMALEIAQLQGFKLWYYDIPSHGSASYYWLVIFISFVVLLYLLSSFSYRWITGPYKNEIYIDLFLAHLWLIVSLMNIISALNGESLTCNYPNDENQYVRTTRCRLFLSSMSLGWIVMASYIFSLYISMMRWGKRPIEVISPKVVEPPVVIHKPETYRVQKGTLADGQPALIFHMAQKNNSSSNLSTRGSPSGNVTPTSPHSPHSPHSHNASTSNSHNLGLHANHSRTSIYLHDKDVKN